MNNKFSIVNGLDKEKELYKDAIAAWGNEAQIIKAIKEFSEISVLLAKILNYPKYAHDLENITQELADAQIMINQLRIVFDIFPDYFTEIKNKKLERVSVLLAEHGYKKETYD